MRAMLDDLDHVRAQFLRVSAAQTDKAARAFVAVLCEHLGPARLRAIIADWEKERPQP